MSSRTSPSANDSGFGISSRPGLFHDLVAVLRGWIWPVPAGLARDAATPPVIEAILPPAPVRELHYLRRVAGSAGRWKRQMAEAQRAWPRLTPDELVASDGHVCLLSELLQARYELSAEDAKAQVLQFFAAQTVQG